MNQAVAPARFFLKPPLLLRREVLPHERRRWEIYKGNLVDPVTTRQEAEFYSQLIYLDESAKPAQGPTLGLRWDRNGERIYITRGFAVHGHEAYAEGNIIKTRPIVKWQEELVGTICLKLFEEQMSYWWPSRDESHRLADFLGHYVLLAVVGTSHLPITSVESPLPLYSVGKLAYLPSAGAPRVAESPITSFASLADFVTEGRYCHAPNNTQASVLDACLRVAEADAEVIGLTRQYFSADPDDDTDALYVDWFGVLRELFNQLSLSPWTEQSSRLLVLLRTCADLISFPEFPSRVASSWLRMLCQHLTAFDLRRFHNQGANYPDALFLDQLLRFLAEEMESSQTLWRQQGANDPWHRQHVAMRASWRDGWLLRKQLEGTPVPEMPTSPGENQRMDPGGRAAIPEEQFTNPGARPVRLFAGEPAEVLLSPIAENVLEQSLAELIYDERLLGLGKALFLDRPFGALKGPREADRTPLLSYVAFSREIALSRLRAWRDLGKLSQLQFSELDAGMRKLKVTGISVMDLPQLAPRPGVVCLEDALNVSKDFTILNSTYRSREWLLRGYGLASREEWEMMPPWLLPFLRGQYALLMRSPQPRVERESRAMITLYDDEYRPRVEFGAITARAQEVRYVEWCGVEYLADGLELLHLWNEDGTVVPLNGKPRVFRCDPQNFPVDGRN